MYSDGFIGSGLFYYPAFTLYLFLSLEDDLSSLNASEFEAVERVKDQFTSRKELKKFIHGLRS